MEHPKRQMIQGMMLTQIEAAESLRLVQERYCHARDLPLFTLSIYCDFCHRNIYARVTVEDASTHHITACPHCHRSFSE